ncbi:FliA/WhiG family RNA polymerase sigma factor [Burkholderia sp. AU42008]|uniref:FliA/WhiG family RNA polymerase sigma factor n=1 Tax=unclassified Burkholderia TaxID=2613784 RepID=UPI000B79F693|nr:MULTISPECIES: FliA/WhiG family RNA polymerase sigma factor [unclassified Burkholderia]MBR8238339.1 FliA/WhiG family RNA polymerase sigma factor [Burkholderia sp. AU32357]MBY4877504.1 FliA/WhiG family RNA polymerase sigma factor [Burkholderia sp. AU42008]OXI37406.1 RNA polymerase sigma factor FliA [Burkholderia sp. AU17457]
MTATIYTEYQSVQRENQTLSSADEARWMTQYAPLVKRIVRKLASQAGGAMEACDLEQLGLMGLLEALRRYGEPDDEFEHFALFRVRGAILDELRRQDWRPRSARQGAHRLRSTERALRRELRRDPTKEEVCNALEIGDDEYEQLQLDDCAQEFVSFDALLEEDAERYECGGSDGIEHRAMLRRSLEQALGVLDAREQQIIQLYYEFDLSQAEIGAVLGLTRARVCQINKSALVKMRKRLAQH